MTMRTPAGGTGLGLDLTAGPLSLLGAELRSGAEAAPAATPTPRPPGGASPPGAAAPQTSGERPAAVLTAAQARLRRALFGRRGPVMLRQPGQQASVALLPVAAGDDALPTDTPWLALDVNGAPAAVALPWAVTLRLAGQPLETADPEDAGLLLEHALTGWLNAAELATGLALRFRGLDAAPPTLPDAVAARLTVDLALPRPARQALLLRLSAAAAEALLPALIRLARPRDDLPGLVLRVAIERSGARLTLAELRSLRPGDALILADEADAGGPMAVIEQRLAAPVQAAGHGRWALSGPFSPRADRVSSFMSKAWQTEMTQTPSDAPVTPPGGDGAIPTDAPLPEAGGGGEAPSESPQPAPATQQGPAGLSSLDALELRLAVRVGEAMMSLAELRQAGPGTVVTLDRPDGALVDLVVNGQVIGTGQIITVAGQKACEIRSLFGDG